MSTTIIQAAPVRKTLVVKTDRSRAFAAFTKKIGTWWPRRHTIGSSPQADVVLESRVGGRWYERGTDGSECEWGKVLAWEPPVRLVLAWQIGADWKYNPALITEVEVRFVALGASETRVELEHRNLERLGDAAQALRAQFDSPEGWGTVLAAYGAAAEC